MPPRVAQLTLADPIRPIIAAYYFPNYHADARNAVVHGPGWTEWDVLRQAQPRWPGHQQPKVPLWGYEDEADLVAMAKKMTRLPTMASMRLYSTGITMTTAIF